jgi:hypothetical protein
LEKYKIAKSNASANAIQGILFMFANTMAGEKRVIQGRADSAAAAMHCAAARGLLGASYVGHAGSASSISPINAAPR